MEALLGYHSVQFLNYEGVEKVPPRLSQPLLSSLLLIFKITNPLLSFHNSFSYHFICSQSDIPEAVALGLTV